MKQPDNTLSLFDINSESAIDILLKNEKLKRYYVETKNIPKAYHGKTMDVKAIFLFPDPSLHLKYNFKYVYGLEDTNSKYFVPFKNNLKLVGLNLDDIYIQNLVQNYCNIHHDKNPVWYEIAEIWKPFLKQELDTLYSPKIPAFVASSKLLQALMPHTINKMKVKEYSVNGEFINPKDNYLNRTLIPMFMTHDYRKYELTIRNLKKLFGT